MKETMNIHRALSEIKSLKNVLLDDIIRAKFVVANKHSNEKIYGMPKSTVMDSMKSNYQSITTKISRLTALQNGVMLSNAQTRVDISGENYSVAEAIALKNYGMDYKKTLRDQLLRQLDEANRECEKHNGIELDNRTIEYIKSIYGSTDLKTATEEVSKKEKEFRDAQTYELIDPLKVQEIISKLTDEINRFESEVDAVLSTSNATTEITIEY